MKGNYNKLIAGLVVSSLMLVSVASCSVNNDQSGESVPSISSSASWVKSFRSLNELTTYPDVDMIAVGVIDSVVKVINYSPIPEHPDYMTSFAFRVERILKGKEAQEIIVYQGGAPDKPGSDFRDDPLFQIGNRYILFLTKVEGSPNEYNHFGPWGRYQIINNKVYSLNNTLADSKAYQAPAGLDFDGVDLSTFTEDVIEILDRN